MAAHEEDEQRVVAVRDLWGLLQRREALARATRLFAPPLVEQPPRGRLDQPPARLLRHALARPVQRGGEQRLLDGVLGRGEVA
jgi:hypothetical protein